MPPCLNISADYSGGLHKGNDIRQEHFEMTIILPEFFQVATKCMQEYAKETER